VKLSEAMSSYAGPPSKTSGAGVLLGAVDIVGGVVVVVDSVGGGDRVGVHVVGGPGCLLAFISGEVLDVGAVGHPGLGGILHVHGHVAGVLHPEQVDAVRHIVAWLNGQLLHELVVLSGLFLVGSGGHPDARCCSHTGQWCLDDRCWLHSYHVWLLHCLGICRRHRCLGVGTGYD
jgi:hypothetical protein